MLIKETICTEIDERGRVIKQTRKVSTYESNVDYGYDYGTRYGEFGEPRRSSLDRIMDSYLDYRRTQEW